MLHTRIHSVLQLPVAAFHTTPIVQATRRAALARASKKKNIERRAQRIRAAEVTKPHPVLGHRPDDDSRWRNCDLAKVLVNQREIRTAPVPPFDSTKPPELPQAFQWGINDNPAVQQLLLDDLPEVSEQVPLYRFLSAPRPTQQAVQFQSQLQQLHTVNTFARITDLRNASAAGIAFENRRRCVRTFSEQDKANDTGRPEVQAALLTMKMRKLWDHLQRNRKDISNKRSLRKLVHQRAKILKYLKRLDRQRYETVLGRLGIEEEAIDGELVV